MKYISKEEVEFSKTNHLVMLSGEELSILNDMVEKLLMEESIKEAEEAERNVELQLVDNKEFKLPDGKSFLYNTVQITAKEQKEQTMLEKLYSNLSKVLEEARS